MANFFSSSEEENFELISSWWNKYKYVAIFLLFIVISGILFFEYWTQASQNKRHELAQEYHVFIESLDDTSQENKQNIRDFIERFTDTPYANMASLHLSKVYVENGDLIEASKELKNIIESTSSSWGNQYDPIESTARLRLAKILLSLEKPQEALEVVKQAKVLNGAMLEVKGDAESQLNRFNEANISYLQALESTQSSSLKSLIRMKIADLQTDSDDK